MEPWTHGPNRRFCDPMNLAFGGAFGDAQGVAATLLSVNLAGTSWMDQWHRPQFWEVATNQYVLRGSRLVPQDVQLVAGNLFTRRYHVRLWNDPAGGALGSAHYEKWAFWTHEVQTFEDAERKVGDDLQSIGRPVSFDATDLRNLTDYPPNNGYVTEVT